MGKGTEAALNSLLKQSDFTGYGQPIEVAKQFKIKLGVMDVLFPISAISKCSIQAELPIDQVVNVMAYSVKEDSIILPTQDVYLFTSPSNVSSFLAENTIPQQAKIIAIGPSTLNILKKNNYSCVAPKNPTLEDMLSLI